ncbi:hypothetical protein ACO0E1_16400 [Curtobacterium sp. RRHDQ66]|uniref:hypothetical protein n=1 Tax=Curtobacterium guangdongense TaxID=3413380 RepID=UPI003BF02A69
MAFVLGVLVPLSGCAQQSSEEKALDADQARVHMRAFVQSTMDLTGLDWISHGGAPIAFECGKSDGGAGVAFSWDQHATGVEQPGELVKKVGAEWEARGLSPSYRDAKRNDGLTLYSVAAEGDPVRTISFNASEHRTSIQVDSSCGTGNIADYEQ